MGKINMGIFYGKKYSPCNRTFSLENGENFIEGTGLYQYSDLFLTFDESSFHFFQQNIPYITLLFKHGRTSCLEYVNSITHQKK